MLKSDLVRNKVMGRITVKNDKTHVSFRTYRGYTDVLSIVTMFMISFISTILADVATGALNMMWKLLLPILFCLIAASFSWIVSHTSEDGQENENLLIEFLKDGLELKDELT
ncbi:hypothetical protein NV379_05060 [Paenibacillus sp. N1-5-1-14]|uniref:hypothetical protein n=1 Tax=Paenibacillus radicibacter TaxID=2972488 RepID=UPI0021599605|nr:hypothetical protein [Paenibacillus radicibacter]MCR8642020.1 hypothetical protein [Paenibacillus radicibacter]